MLATLPLGTVAFSSSALAMSTTSGATASNTTSNQVVGISVLTDLSGIFADSLAEVPAEALLSHVAELRLKSTTTSGRCVGEWRAKFKVDEADRDDANKSVAVTLQLAFERTAERSR